MTNDDIAREAAAKLFNGEWIDEGEVAALIMDCMARATAQKDEEIAQLQQIIQQLETQLQQQDQL